MSEHLGLGVREFNWFTGLGFRLYSLGFSGLARGFGIRPASDLGCRGTMKAAQLLLLGVACCVTDPCSVRFLPGLSWRELQLVAARHMLRTS